MRPLSSLGIGLILVFGCLLLALVAELYYLLWWKKRVTNTDIEDDYHSPAKELFYTFCWKKPPLLGSTALNPQELSSVRITGSHGYETENQLDLRSSSNKELLLKPFEDDEMDSELLMLQNLCGPPRFLFTIKEETKEDLESEDGKSRGEKSRKGSRSRSLSDILPAVETPFLTPMPSPPFFTPPLTPINTYNHHGFNPLYESSTEAELNRVRSSPPPKFKFLKDAEEKLYRRKLMEEAEKRNHQNSGSAQDGLMKSSPASSVVTEEDGSFITIIVGKNKERESHHHNQLPHHHSSTSQVLPLACSPPTIQPDYRKPIFQSSPMLR